MNEHANEHSLAIAFVGALLIGVSHDAPCAAFAIAAQSASAIGNANAGAAASAEDASTVWWNPAGMSFIEKGQAVQVFHLDDPTTRFSDTASQPALGQPLKGEGGDAGHYALIPQLYAVFPLGKSLAVGIAINSPFGLKTKYEDEWAGRFQAVKSQVRTININPAISYRLERLSLGAGVDVQRFDAELTNSVNYTAPVVQGLTTAGLTAAQIAALLNPANPATIAGLEGRLRIQGDDTAVGWNVGAIYEVTPELRVGVQYRSEIKYHVKGDVKFDQPASVQNPLAATIIGAVSRPGAPLADGPVSADLTLPQTAGVSLFWQPNDKWDVLLDASWTAWSSIPEVRFVRDDGTLFSRLEYNWRDTWRYALGANYKHNDQWKLRVGFAWDESVIRDDTFREPRLPDSEHLWASVGARYQFSPRVWFDMAFTHVKPKDARLTGRNNGSTAIYGLLDGTYHSSVRIYSVQASATF